MNYYFKALSNYANFEGRARRSEYWFFVLFNVLFAFGAIILDAVLGTEMVFYILYCLFVFMPGLTLSVRRLHDVGKSGWMFLIILIPIIGAIWLFILYVTDSESESNEYGPNPKINQ